MPNHLAFGHGVAYLDDPRVAGLRLAGVQPGHAHDQEHQGDEDHARPDGLVARIGRLPEAGDVDRQAEEVGDHCEHTTNYGDGTAPLYNRREFHLRLSSLVFQAHAHTLTGARYRTVTESVTKRRSRNFLSVYYLLVDLSHNEACSGCTVSLTTAGSSRLVNSGSAGRRGRPSSRTCRAHPLRAASRRSRRRSPAPASSRGWVSRPGG
jgi:hypothetical protein